MPTRDGLLGGGFQQFYEHPRLDRFRTPAWRKTLALLFVSSALLAPVITGLTGDYWPSLVTIIPLTIFGFLLDAAVRGISELPAAQLDEHQRSIRHAAFHDAYWPAVLVTLAGGIAVGVRLDVDTAMAAALMTVPFALALEFPALVLAWRLPGDTADE